jgi:DNA-binding beta-propeller fold protein YncE
MIRRFRFDGGSAPFEGRREVLWRQLPEGAEIRSARATVAPVSAPGASAPFLERIEFDGARGAWGAIRRTAPGSVEVAFHARRTLASVQGTGLAKARLLVDLGGVFQPVGPNGELAGPVGPPFALAGDPAPLPGLAVTGFRLVPEPNEEPSPEVTAVWVRSVPANVSLAVGDLPPFWTRPGELAAPETTPDFAATLQAYLAGAPVEHGVHVVPLVLRSDTIARLAVELEIELAVASAALPGGLPEATLFYDFGSVPRAGAALPPVRVPAGHRVSATRGRMVGSFQGGRVVLGPTGAVAPAGTVEVSPDSAQARLLVLDGEAVAADGADLLVAAVSRTARLQLDFRVDLDGKPGGASLLDAPVCFEIDRTAAGGPTWVSVPLPRELQLTGSRAWLTLQSLEGTAAWSVVAGGPAMQRTPDGGHSWRRSEAPGVAEPAALFRLRRKTRGFTMPVELEVGGERVSLERFEPLRRLDLSLDFPEVAQALNRALDAAGPASCPEVEHLADGAFTRWLSLGEELGEEIPIPLEATASATTSALLVAAPDGRRAHVAVGGADREARVHTVDLACGEVVATLLLSTVGAPTALVLDPGGSRAFLALDGRSELHTLDLDLGRTAVRTVTLPVTPTALALSADGERLFVGHEPSDELALDHGVAAIRLDRLEAAGRRGAALGLGDVEMARLGFGRRPQALTAGALGHVMVLAGDEAGREASEVLRLAARELRLDPATAAVEPAVALATARSGELTLVAGSGPADGPPGTLRILDSRTGREVAAIPLSVAPRSVAASPDGSRAYVAGRGGLAVVDLRRRREAAVRMRGADLAAVALTPEGERVLATRLPARDGGEPPALLAASVGVPVPAEWALLSGRAWPVCLEAPRRPAVALGGVPSVPSAGPSVLAQPVPVAAGCPYELAFDGLASEEGSRVSVTWRRDDCAVLGSHTSPLQVADLILDRPVLVRHRARFPSPEGAAQAEVRIEVTSGIAVLTDVSLRATAERVTNPDLAARSAAGTPTGWQAGPGGAPGLTSAARGSLLRNPGPREVVLFQTLAAEAGREFTLELDAAAGGAAPAGSLRLWWIGADDRPVEEPLALEIPASGFDRQMAAGTVPEGAVEARLELAVAPSRETAVRDVSLRFDPLVEVPVTFVAQAPGELTVSGWEVCHEPVTPAAPGVPETGLCSPSPVLEGKPRAKERCYCAACGEERTLRAGAPAVTETGRPATVGTCAACGTPMVSLGGRPAPDAEVLVPLASPPATRVDLAQIFFPPALPGPAAPGARLTQVTGIADRRAELLAAAGIDSLERLSFGSLREIADALPRVSPELAADFIRQARELLREGPLADLQP